MFASAARSLFRRSSQRLLSEAPAVLVPSAAELRPVTEAAKVEAKVRTAWPASRLALANELWGTGFIFPGGESETLRLARPLGVSAAASLLIVGVGSGGPAGAVSRNLGAWVTGMDNDPSLLAAARGLITQSQLNRKVVIQPWDPANPSFGSRSHHHCLALEPFHGAHPEVILDAVAKGLKAGGQIVITQLAAAGSLNAADPVVRRWAELEHRDPAHVLTGVSVTRMLGRIGFDVRIAEDISQRHVDHALLGWRVLLRGLGEATPTSQQAAQLVREAELWLLRRRLIRDGRLRMMRWHAIGPARV